MYITVDQGIVQPHTTQRREGWHGDSYRKIETRKNPQLIPVDHIYVIADACPTQFAKGPFSFEGVDPENIDQVQEHFQSVAKKQNPLKYSNYTILRMDPYCVHNVGANETDHPLHRTFVKISISRIKYCKLGNAHNQLFVYDWPLVPRYGVPYTRDALRGGVRQAAASPQLSRDNTPE